MNTSNNYKFDLRPIKKSDQDIVLSMRNSPYVRSAMINDIIISEKDHDIWFSNMLSDQSKDFYIFEVDNKIQGVAGFFNINKDKADWTFYLKNALSSKGLGRIMCKMALNKFFDKHETTKIITQVKSDNISSVKIHEKLGFQKDTDYSENSDHITLFVLEKKGWIALRETLD